MYEEKLEISARENLVILDDRNQSCWDSSKLLESKFKEAGCCKALYTFDQMGLEKRAFAILRHRFPNPNLTPERICIFLGRSAAKIRKNAEQNDCNVFDLGSYVSIHAERRFDFGGRPKATVGEVFTEQTLFPKVREIIVLDDVISSGATMRACLERNRHKFPLAKWYACALLSRLKKIQGYEDVMTPVLVLPDSYGLKVPINSLSTLLEDGEVARDYAKKHCLRSEILMEALASLRSEQNGK